MSKIYIKKNDKNKFVKILRKSYKYNDKNNKHIEINFNKDNYVFPIKINVTTFSDDEYVSIIINFVADKITIDDTNPFNFNFTLEAYRHFNPEEVNYCLGSNNQPTIKDWLAVINGYMKHYYNKDNYIDIIHHGYTCVVKNNEFVTTEKVWNNENKTEKELTHIRTIGNFN
jgi:hypothetical protein